MPPISMLALMRRPMMMPEPMLRSETPKPRPTRAENALTTTGMVSTIHCSCVARNDKPESDERGHHRERRLARLRPARVEHDQRLARGDAVGERQVLVVDEVLAQRHRQEHAEQPRRRRATRTSACASGGRRSRCRARPPACRTPRAASTETRSARPSCRPSGRCCSPSGCSSCENRPSARNPKNAETTEMFGPKPNFRTM